MKSDPILTVFEELARRDGTAPVVASPQRQATRDEVLALSRAIERAAGRSAAPPGAYVLIACANGAAFLAAMLGVRRSGRVPVLADWTTPPDERARIAGALGIAAAVVCDEAFPDQAAAVRTIPLPAAPATPAAGVDYVKVTSGSTGTPSGIAVTAESLIADDEQIASSMGISGDDRILAQILWSHSYALSSAVLPALRRGSLLVISEDGGPWGPLDAGRALGSTFFPTVPVYLHTIASLAEAPVWPASIRTVISAGSPLRPDTAARFQAAFGMPVHVFYGASECGGICYDREGSAALRGTVGTPLNGVTVELCDGAVRVRSAAVGSGYVPVAREELSGGTFLAADLGTWTSGGELALLGRADALINAGGKKVHPAEVENVLREMPGVREVVVVGVAAEQGEREIVRAVIACDPARVTYEEVAAWCRVRLAAHKVPRSILLVDDIPRTARGKIDRAALAGRVPAPVER
jgi:long-chain acyl-CoA synthetase